MVPTNLCKPKIGTIPYVGMKMYTHLAEACDKCAFGWLVAPLRYRDGHGQIRILLLVGRYVIYVSVLV